MNQDQARFMVGPSAVTLVGTVGTKDGNKVLLSDGTFRFVITEGSREDLEEFLVQKMAQAYLDGFNDSDKSDRLHDHLCDAIGLPRHVTSGVAINEARLMAHEAKRGREEGIRQGWREAIAVLSEFASREGISAEKSSEEWDRLRRELEWAEATNSRILACFNAISSALSAVVSAAPKEPK